MSIGYVWEDIYTQHVMGEYHPESPFRLMAVKEVIEDVRIAQYLTKLHPEPATKEQIARVHDPAYIDQIEATAGRIVVLDADTSTSPRTWEAACLAAGGAIACVDYVLNDKHHTGAFAFVRPPGHHAEHGRAMGFCIFNNIAIAAEYALRECGLKRVAILDFDVHHGNGTQGHFYDRGEVLFASTHRMPFYPGTGHATESGKGGGKGLTVNVVLRAGQGDAEFREAWQKILPSVTAFKPELILVSAGYDAHEDDPLGGMRVTTDSYRWLAAELVKLSKDVCRKRLVFVLEGGYSLGAIKSCVRATLKEMV